MAKQIKIKRLSSTAKLPTKKPEDIGWDCYVDRIWIEDGALMYGFGIAVEPPEGYYVDLVPRSSLSKQRWVVGNSFGVIDPKYRGELKAALKPVGDVVMTEKGDAWNICFTQDVNCNLPPFAIGDRPVQMILREIIESELIESDLSETERGEGGFGSTGK